MKTTKNPLRIVRIVLATVCFAAVSLLLLGAGWHLNLYLSWAAQIQFLPALLALNFGILAVLIVLTGCATACWQCSSYVCSSALLR